MIPPSERTKTHRTKLKAEGWSRMTVWLSPEQTKALTELSIKTGESKVEVMRMALDEMETRLEPTP